MEIKKIIDTLHPLERKVLPVLDKVTELNDIINKTKLKDVEVMRALQWLSNKDIIKLKENQKEIVELGENGEIYKKEGLPEKRLIEVISDKDFSSSESQKSEIDSSSSERFNSLLHRATITFYTS